MLKIERNSNIAKQIEHYFLTLLNRSPLPNDVDYYCRVLESGKVHISEIPGIIKSSEEFQFYEKHQDKLAIFKRYNLQNLEQELKYQSTLKHPNAIYYVDVEKVAYESNPVFTERFTEYFWILKNIKTDGKLLDIGCTESSLAHELSKIRTLEVYGLDIRPEENPTFNFFLESATKTHFEDNFFDQITIVSSIEHFGLSVYGNKIEDIEADLKAMVEIKRILKNNGFLFLTTPFGINAKPSYRKYNNDSLNKLFIGFKIVEQKYFHQTDEGWKEIDMKTASTVGDAKYYLGDPLPGAIVVVKAQPHNC